MAKKDAKRKEPGHCQLVELESLEPSDNYGNSNHSDSDSTNLWRILVLGAPKCGKKSLAYKYTKRPRDEVKFGKKHSLQRLLTIDNDRKLNMEIIYPAESYSDPLKVPKYLFENIHALMFVFSTVDYQSFSSLADWFQMAADRLPNMVPVVFAENKIDLVDNSVMESKEVEAMAKKHRFRLYRCSAVEDFNVDESFCYLAQKAVKTFPDAKNIEKLDLTASKSSLKSMNTLSVDANGMSRASSSYSNFSTRTKSDTGDELEEEVKTDDKAEDENNDETKKTKEKCSMM